MKKFSILNGLSWLTSKISFVEKCGNTISAFLKTIKTFEAETRQIWDKPKKELKHEEIKEVIDLDIPTNSINTDTDEKK